MKKMTKNLVKELLKDDNHLEGLSYFCNRIAKFKTYEEALRQKNKDWNKMIEWAYEFETEADEEDYNDYSGNALRIDTGIYCVIDVEFI